MPLDESSRPPRQEPEEDREVDYLMCSQCGTPCYVFEMDGGRIREATCLVCGNDEAGMFQIGDEAGTENE